MNHKIIICGGNGAGKSTLGKALSKKTGWVFKDIEDYYFPKNDPMYPYAVQRTKEEVISLLYDDMNRDGNFILSAVIRRAKPKDRRDVHRCNINQCT